MTTTMNVYVSFESSTPNFVNADAYAHSTMASISVNILKEKLLDHLVDGKVVFYMAIVLTEENALVPSASGKTISVLL